MKISWDEEKFYEKIFDSYSQNTKCPSEEELSCVELSQEFEEKMHRLIKGEKPFKVHTSQKAVRLIASFVIVFALAVGVFTIGTVAQLTEREQKVKDIIEIYNTYMYETEKPRSAYYGLSYVVEGYSEAGGGGDGNYVRRIYKNKNGESITIYQYMEEIPIPQIDRFADVHEDVNGGLYVLNTATGRSRYIWSDLGYVFDLRADNCTKEELLKMADGLKRR